MSTADDHLAWLEAAAAGDGQVPASATVALRDVAMAHARASREEGNTDHQMFHQLVAGQMTTTIEVAHLRVDIQELVARIAALEDAHPGLEDPR